MTYIEYLDPNAASVLAAMEDAEWFYETYPDYERSLDPERFVSEADMERSA